MPSEGFKAKFSEDEFRLYMRKAKLKSRGWKEEEILKAVEEYSNTDVCAICKKKAALLRMDHCHKSKLFRGVLCNRCNLAIGLFEDNSDILRAAANYVDSNGKFVYN